MLLTQTPSTPKGGDGKGPVVKAFLGGMSKKLLQLLCNDTNDCPSSYPLSTILICFFNFSGGSVKPMHPSNTISLLCYSGKLGICTIVFLETVLKALILSTSVDPPYSHKSGSTLVTNQKKKLSFLCRKSNLCEGAKYLPEGKACEICPTPFTPGKALTL